MPIKVKIDKFGHTIYGCGCNGCISGAAIERLIEAGLCADSNTGYDLLDQILPIPSSFLDKENMAILTLIAGYHGATIYKILLARKT